MKTAEKRARQSARKHLKACYLAMRPPREEPEPHASSDHLRAKLRVYLKRKAIRLLLRLFEAAGVKPTSWQHGDGSEVITVTFQARDVIDALNRKELSC